MWRKVWILVVSAAVVIVLELSSSSYTHRVIDDYVASIDAVEEHVKAEDWRAAYDELEAMSAKWERSRATLEIWISHNEAETAACGMRDVRVYIQLTSADDCRVALETLRADLEHILHKNRLTAANLL